MEPPRKKKMFFYQIGGWFGAPRRHGAQVRGPTCKNQMVFSIFGSSAVQKMSGLRRPSGRVPRAERQNQKFPKLAQRGDFLTRKLCVCGGGSRVLFGCVVSVFISARKCPNAFDTPPQNDWNAPERRRVILLRLVKV